MPQKAAVLRMAILPRRATLLKMAPSQRKAILLKDDYFATKGFLF